MVTGPLSSLIYAIYPAPEPNARVVQPMPGDRAKGCPQSSIAIPPASGLQRTPSNGKRCFEQSSAMRLRHPISPRQSVKVLVSSASIIHA